MFMKPSRFSVVIFWLAATICLIGLAEATYLTVVSLTGGTAVCGGSADCSQVLGSKYSKIAGLPLASLGAAAYYTAFSFAVFAAFGRPRARRGFFAVVLAMFVVTLWLLFVQAFLLHAFCRYCLFSAALVFFLTGIVLIAPGPRTNELARSR
jgi:uncharacterized membrane protein